MKARFPGTVGVALLALAGAGLFASGAATGPAPVEVQLAQAQPGTQPMPERDTPPAQPAPGAPPMGGQAPGGAMQSAPAADLAGKDVVDSSGARIGKVDQVIGNDTLIVSTGGFLGIGAKQVSVPRNRVSLSGSGDDLKVTTSMTEDELKGLPEYKSPGSMTR
jgi:sporulation protein YlmC with PRC-barrel domain